MIASKAKSETAGLFCPFTITFPLLSLKPIKEDLCNNSITTYYMQSIPGTLGTLENTGEQFCCIIPISDINFSVPFSNG
jgi:hypothetical protein